MTTEIQTLLDKFQEIFPEIDFSDVTSGYNQVETKILNYGIDKLTAEQWKAILDREYDDLFQDGMPHVSWNTDRKDIFKALIYYKNLKVFKTWKETWHTAYIWYADMGSVKLQLKKEEPNPFSNCFTRYNIKIVDEIPEYPTHIVYKLGIFEGRVSIVDQFLGTLDKCTEWASKQGGICRMVENK
jgi:hypothetical protein